MLALYCYDRDQSKPTDQSKCFINLSYKFIFHLKINDIGSKRIHSNGNALIHGYKAKGNHIYIHTYMCSLSTVVDSNNHPLHIPSIPNGSFPKINISGKKGVKTISVNSN